MLSQVSVMGIEESMIAAGYSYKAERPKEHFIPVSNDRERNVARKLGNLPSNTGEDNFLSGIIAQFDMEATNKLWVEAERYHFFQIVTSQSTMHRLSRMPMSTLYVPDVDPRIIDIMRDIQEEYNKNPTLENFYRLVYSNPSGCLITARITTNYRQLKTIYNQRHNHKLHEWQVFCEEIKQFPEFKELCLGGAC